MTDHNRVMTEQRGQDADGNCSGNLGQARQLALLQQFRGGGDGHRQAYARLVESLSGMAWRMANGIAREYGVDADDLFQDGFLYGMQPALTSYDASSGYKITTYVLTIVKRVMIKRAGRYKRWRMELIKSSDESSSESAIVKHASSEDACDQQNREGARHLSEKVRLAQPEFNSGERAVAREFWKLSTAGALVTHKAVAAGCGKSRSRVTQLRCDLKRKLLSIKDICEMARELGYYVDSPKPRERSCR